MQMRKTKKLITYLMVINLILLSLILINKVPIIDEIIDTVTIVIIAPFVFGGFLFYLLRPIRNFVMKLGFGKNISVIVTMTIFLILMIVVGKYYGEYFINQLIEIKKIVMGYIEEYEVQQFVTEKLGDGSWVNKGVDGINIVVSKGKGYINKGMSIFSGVMLSILAVYFLLKDGEEVVYNLVGFVNERDKPRVEKWLKEGDRRLSTYILGQAAVALSLSIMIFIGYKIIGMGSSLLLASITFILAFIPFIGFYLSMIIPYFIAFIMGFEMVFKLTILIIVAQTLKGRVVVPFVMGKVMKIHPLTDIALVVVGAAIGGPLIAFIIIPCYALVKAFFKERKDIICVIKKTIKR